MKKIFAIVVVLVLIGSFALADVDLSGMSYDELVALKDEINLAIWNSQEWQEVTVPIGVWKVGEDIPEGHWTIKASPEGPSSWGSVHIGTALDEIGKSIDALNSDFTYYVQIKKAGSSAAVDLEETDIDLKNGTYVIIDNTDMVFSPYAGKPSLGFK